MDELPTGIPAPPESPPKELPTDREARGLFAKGNSLAGLGGKASAGKPRLSERMGLTLLPESAEFRPYKIAGKQFRRAQCTVLAKTVGGGVCGPAPASLVSTAALQLAWSRYLFDKAGTSSRANAKLILEASKLADASRQSLMAAHELCAREAQARAARRTAADAFGAFVDAAKSAVAPKLPKGRVVESATDVSSTVPATTVTVVESTVEKPGEPPMTNE